MQLEDIRNFDQYSLCFDALIYWLTARQPISMLHVKHMKHIFLS